MSRTSYREALRQGLREALAKLGTPFIFASMASVSHRISLARPLACIPSRSPAVTPIQAECLGDSAANSRDDC